MTPSRNAAVPLRPARRFVAALVAFVALASFVVLSLGSPRVARADDALARQHFKQGVDLYDKRQYAPALESFRAAYAEKPSPGIKQNIALCLKGLGRPIEAAVAFDEALDEADETLRPETRAAMERELAQLSKIVATVRLKAIAASDKRPVEGVTVTVDGAPLSAAALRRPIRLEPGIHVFTAHAQGLADPPEKKLSILPGSPVDATFELGVLGGMLTIRPSVADALVRLDGNEVGRGPWSGRVTPGTHKVAVSAEHYHDANASVEVGSGATVDYPITLLRRGEMPPEYDDGAHKPPAQPAQKPRYVVPMLAYDGESLRLAPILGEQAGGAKRSFAGGAVGARIGYRLVRLFALELHGELGVVEESYTLPGANAESKTTVFHWQATPEVRFTTGGSVRFTTAMGVGVHGLSATAEIDPTPAGQPSTKRKLTGSGVSASWLVDMGMQIDVGSLFLEGALFFDMHGVGTTRDDVTNQRFFLSSPATRAGIRVGLGINF